MRRFEARTSRLAGSRRSFAQTWWGKAWIDALEQRAQLDPNRLPRGRTYARQGHVSQLEVVSGEVTALVLGSRASHYRVRLRVRRFDEQEWLQLFATIAGRAAHAAALLDGELDPAVVEAARDADVELLPGPGELGPQCSCPDWADPCKHAAAVCYLVADALDSDPFALLLLRGRTREEVLAGVRAQRSVGVANTAPGEAALTRPQDAGIRASEAWARRPAEMPAPPTAPPRPGTIRPLLDPDPDHGIGAPTAATLAALAADAAGRAQRMVADGAASGILLDERADLARRAAELLGENAFAAFARRVRLGPREAVRLALAWRAAGSTGVELVDGQLAPLTDAERLTVGAASIAERGGPPVKQRPDRLVVGRTHLVLGPDHRWYALERRGNAYELLQPPSEDPAELLEPAKLRG